MPETSTRSREILWDISSYEPFPWQAHFHASKARFRVLACGRRAGKDRACIYELLRLIPRLLKEDRKHLVPPVLVWVVAPTYPLTEQIWAELKVFIPQPGILDVREADKCLKLIGGAEIWLKTAADPERLVGVGLDVLLMTEAALVDISAWEQALRPCLSSPGRAGLAMFNSTPKGLNWFYHLYLRGQDPQDDQVESWNYPTSANSTIEASEIARAKRELPEQVFRQEYMAEFLSDVGLVFRHIDSCVHGDLAGPVEGHRYVMGVDLAKHKDFTVLVVADAGTRRVVHFDRFSQIDWALQKERILAAAKQYNRSRCWLDSTGVGDPIFEDLTRAGLGVEGVTITAPEKRKLVDGLSIALEQETIRFPRIDQLINELKAYQYDTTKAGNIKASAPVGFYDDCVVALALCVRGLGASLSKARFQAASYLRV